MEIDSRKDYEKILLPKSIIDKARYLVKTSSGLFDDEADFISHCVTCYMRKD